MHIQHAIWALLYESSSYGHKLCTRVFQKKAEQLLRDIFKMYIVCDDIIMARKDDNEHVIALQEVFNRTREYDVRFDRHKLQFRQSQVKYIRIKISALGIMPNEEKVKAVLDLPRQQCKKDLHRYLGISTYLSCFLPNFSFQNEY